MTKRPNKMGRIEADPKPKKKLPWKATLYIASVVGLVALGVVSTLQYQQFIDNTKSSGVTEFVLSSCDEYTNKDKTELWLECEPVR